MTVKMIDDGGKGLREGSQLEEGRYTKVQQRGRRMLFLDDERTDSERRSQTLKDTSSSSSSSSFW